VGVGGVRRRQRVVVGDQHPLAIVAGCLTDLLPIDLQLAVPNPQPSAITTRSPQLRSPLRVDAVVPVPRQFFLELADYLLTVQSLPLRLLWVPADQVPAPELALADDHLLHVEVLGDLLEATRTLEHVVQHLPGARHAAREDVASAAAGQVAPVLLGVQDRKSTRLNSS